MLFFAVDLQVFLCLNTLCWYALSDKLSLFFELSSTSCFVRFYFLCSSQQPLISWALVIIFISVWDKSRCKKYNSRCSTTVVVVSHSAVLSSSDWLVNLCVDFHCILVVDLCSQFSCCFRWVVLVAQMLFASN